MHRLIKDGYLQHPQQPGNPCYRKCLSYTFYTLYQQTESIDQVRNEFKKMIDDYYNGKIYRLENHLGMYPIPMTKDSDGDGYLIVDETKDGFYPLVIYPSSNSKFESVPNTPRINGLNVAINDLKYGIEKIIALFPNHNNWESLEQKIEKLFRYPKQGSNDSTYPTNKKSGNQKE